MYITYMDDSASHDDGLQLVGGIVLKDSEFNSLENFLGASIEALVPESLRPSFEFHASELFNSRGPFKDVDHKTAVDLIESCLIAVSGKRIPFTYCAVDTKRLSQTVYGNAAPLGVAFRACAKSVESWFVDNDAYGLTVVVFDDTSKPDSKHAIKSAFRDLRKPVKSMGGSRGALEHVHDDLYFGDSAYSVGLQVADVCTYIVNRHLNKRADTERLYALLEPSIFSPCTLP